jgi:hypothetical protein
MRATAGLHGSSRDRCQERHPSVADGQSSCRTEDALVAYNALLARAGTVADHDDPGSSLTRGRARAALSFHA